MRPDSPIAGLPVSIRLALRDLKNNKLRALSFGLLLTLALGILLPTLIAPHLDSLDGGATSSIQQAASFRESSTPERKLVAVFQGVGGPVQDFLEANPSTSAFEELVLVPEVEVAFTDPTQQGDDATSMAVTLALLDQAPLNQTVTVLEGRTPNQSGEFVLDPEMLADNEELSALFAGMQIGETRQFNTLNGPVPLTFVGTVRSHLPLSWSIATPMVAAPGTFGSPDDYGEYPGWPTRHHGLAFGSTELEMDTAIQIAQSFVGSYEPFAFSVVSASMKSALEFEFQMSQVPAGLPNDTAGYPMVTFLIVLLFLAVIGVPLFTLSNLRRQEELVQLRKTGASTTTLWGSLVTSAFLVAGCAAFFGFLCAVILLRLIFPFLPLHMVYSPANIAAMVILAFLGAFGTALISASIPAFFTLRNTNQLSGAQPGAGNALNPRPSTSPRTKLALLILGIGIAFLIFGLVSASTGRHPTAGLDKLVIGAIIILVGVYFLVPLLLTKLVVATQSRALPLRLAARELTTRPATTITAIVPVAFVSAFITIFGIIFRQHYLEDYLELGQPDPTYAMIFPILWVPIAAGVVIVLLTLSATYLSLPQLQQDRAALHNMGQPSNLTGRTEGIRAGLMAGLGIIVGSLVGVVLGLVILLFRHFTDGHNIPLQPGAFWAWEIYLIAAIFPIALAYLGGRLMGERTKPSRLAPAV